MHGQRGLAHPGRSVDGCDDDRPAARLAGLLARGGPGHAEHPVQFRVPSGKARRLQRKLGRCRIGAGVGPWPGAGGRSRPGASRSGSRARICWWMRLSSGPGSRPSSSASTWRASWKACSASAWRPHRVQRDHQQAAHALAQRVLRDQRGELGHGLLVTAQIKQDLGALFGRGRPQLGQADPLGPGERPRHPGERRSMPFAERDLQRGDRPVQVTRGAQAAAILPTPGMVISRLAVSSALTDAASSLSIAPIASSSASI